MRDNHLKNNRYYKQRIMSQRTPTQNQQGEIKRSSPYVKINFSQNIRGQTNDRVYNKIKQDQQQHQQTEYKSQRYSCKHYHRGEQQKFDNNNSNQRFNTKSKIYRSYSSVKKSNNNKKVINNAQFKDMRQNTRENEDFVIRVPKNEDLIENYIQQLKQLKRKVSEQRKEIGELQNNRNNRNNKLHQNNINGKQKQKQKQNFLLKLPEKQQHICQDNKNANKTNNKERVSFFISDRQVLGLIRKTQQIRTTGTTNTTNTTKGGNIINNNNNKNNNKNSTNSMSKITNQKKIFSRDMKKHIKKLKMFKEFVDQNQNDAENDGQNCNGNYDGNCQQNHYQQKNDINNIYNNNNHQFTRSPSAQPYFITTRYSKKTTHQPNNQQFHHHQQSINRQSTSIPLFYPKKVIYGNVINLKQSFNIKDDLIDYQKIKQKRIATHRYSTQANSSHVNASIRRLYSVSKSIDLRKNINTHRYGNQSIDDDDGDNLNNKNNNMIKMSNKCKSLMLRRKTQQVSTSKKTNNKIQDNFQLINNNLKRPLRPINFIHHINHINNSNNSNVNNSSIVFVSKQRQRQKLKQKQKLPQKPHTQRSPTKNNNTSSPKKTATTIVINSASPTKNVYINHNNNNSPQKFQIQQQNPFKSIQGYSTIEDRKQTLDILGESCLQIKHNLLESHKKMEHILDLLQQNIIGLEHKEKKRKSSYERFSKAFPKGFFK